MTDLQTFQKEFKKSTLRMSLSPNEGPPHLVVDCGQSINCQAPGPGQVQVKVQVNVAV